MKALQDRCVAEDGVLGCLKKRNETLKNEQDQYKDALYTLNKEVKELNEKLKDETRQKEKEQEAKATLEKELMALYGPAEMARADAIQSSRLHSLSLMLVPSTMVTGLRIT